MHLLKGRGGDGKEDLRLIQVRGRTNEKEAARERFVDFRRNRGASSALSSYL